MYAVPATPALAPSPPPIVARCNAEARSISRRVKCGHVVFPLDRGRPGGKKIRVYFELYPRRDRTHRASSTVVSLEGGPGFPVSLDRSARAEIWRPVARHRNLLLVDLRGTGKSDALACKAFAKAAKGYVARAGRCARQIGPKRDLYSTAQAVLDVEGVLRALHQRKIDLYGDSYGSYAAEAYALRFPGRLRSLTLDGTYPLPGTDPAWADLLEAIRRGLHLVCDRRPGCPARARGVDPVELVAGFADRVRTQPILGFAPDGDGTRTRVRLNEDAFVQIVSAGYWHPALWRDILAAVAAAEDGDNAPILRLGAETVTVEAGPADPDYWSDALYLSVICHDYPQLWDPATPMTDRLAEIDTRVAAYPPGTWEPFSAEAWLGTDYEGALACLRWPSPRRPDPPDPPGAVYPDVPTLVLNGDLDTITASSGAVEVANRFPGSTFVEMANSFHVTAIYDHDHCASRIYARFVRRLDPGNASCSRRVAEVHVVPRFPTTLAGVRPARSLPGDESELVDRRLAAAAASAVADVQSRWFVNYDGTSVGLRGGRWSYGGSDAVRFRLRNVQFVPDVHVSGRAVWREATDGSVRAQVTVRGPRGRSGSLVLRWSMRRQLAQATLTGTIGSRSLRATMLAP
jgi:pimeloyl-ACP methyl ester carboxylesterase